jgi:UDP-N-acetylmuramate--alanine ligase
MGERINIDKTKGFSDNITVENGKIIHFIGLGGIGMSGLAKFLLELGYNVSGSDIKDSPTMFSISAHGGTVYVGHNAENIEKASLIVASSAIKTDNPEIAEAIKRNIPIIHRSQVLEALMSGLGRSDKQISIGVAGTHGKTTTTGMISLVFDDAKTNPSIVVGGQMPFLNTNSKMGSGKYFIAELDESDGTIELYSPNISIITNLEHDHPDHYTGGINQLFDTFERYLKGLKTDSKLIVNADCPGVRQLISKINHPEIIFYSTDETNELFFKSKYKVKNIVAKGLKTSAQVYKDSELIGELNLGVPGLHNVSDALATIATALECGIKFEQISYSLNRFTGMKRRFQLLGTVNGAKVIDDYAHHPTELQAVLSAAKNVVESEGKGRVFAIFQPHRYTRLANLWNDFIKSFNDADVVYICDVYAASEKPIANISSEIFAKEIKHSNVHYASGPISKLPELISSVIRPDDLVLTIGAGDITKLGNILMEKGGQD